MNAPIRAHTLAALEAASPFRPEARDDERRIAAALTDPEPAVRLGAAEAAARFPGSALVGEALLRLLEGEAEPRVKRAVLRALGSLLAAADLVLEAPDASLDEPAPRRARRARRRVLELLRGERADRSLRGAALEALACEAGSRELRGLVEDLARSLSRRDRQAALRVMGRSGDRVFAEAVLRAFEDRDDAVRSQAFLAAGRLALARAEEPLVEAALHGREAVRAGALSGLAALGSAAARRALRRAAGGEGAWAARARSCLADLRFLDDLGEAAGSET